ncbi:MAG: hypothetical protein ACI92S_003314 [Planctomycetaceae bacterium]|jgi:hypothetical protein
MFVAEWQKLKRPAEVSRTVDFVNLTDTLFILVCAVSLTVRIGIFRGHATPLTGGGSASLKPRDALFALSVAAKHFVHASLLFGFADSDNPGRDVMRKTAIVCAAMAAFVLSGAQAQAGFLFFGNSSKSCCNSAPKCAPAPKCCAPAPKCCNSGGLFSGLKLPKLSLPKLKLPSFGGNKCCTPAPATCSGGHGHAPAAPAAELSPSAGGKKVEDAPAPPPYEDKAPAPAAPKKDKAPAPAAPKAEVKA